MGPQHPSLYQVNTRACLYERGLELQRPATLDDVTEAKVARDGFDWVWLLGVWQTGEAGPDLAVGTPAPEPIDRGRESFYGRLLPVVNFGPTHAQCYVRLAFGDFSARSILLTDLCIQPSGTSGRGCRDGHRTLFRPAPVGSPRPRRDRPEPVTPRHRD